MPHSRISLVNVFFFLAVLEGCQSARHVRTTATTHDEEENPQLIFLTFKAMSGKQAANSFELISSVITDGSLKHGGDEISTGNYLRVLLLDSKGKLIEDISAEHPLLREVEYADANGALARKSVVVPQAEFFVRMQHGSGAESVVLEEYVAGRKMQTLKFNLKKP